MGYKDPEKAAAYAREWRANHSEKVLEDDRQRRAKERVENPSAATQRMRDWRVANPEKAKAQAKIGNEKVKERLATDPIYKEERRQKRAAYMAVPGVRERRREQWREWAAENHSPELARQYSLKKLYGLTPDQYEAMVLAQDGRCAVCRTDKLGGRSDKYWHVDHCHDKDQVRGLLCHSCNTGLGLFKDNPDLLRVAAAYIEQHRQL